MKQHDAKNKENVVKYSYSVYCENYIFLVKFA